MSRGSRTDRPTRDVRGAWPAWLALAALTAAACAPASRTAGMDRRIDVVPRPLSARPLDGSYRLTDPVRIEVAAPDGRAAEIASLLAGVIHALSLIHI